MMHLEPLHRNKNAITFIETIIYAAIVSLFLTLTGGFTWNIISSKIKANSYIEVQQNGRIALETMSRFIRQASVINSPLIGQMSGSISLDISDPNYNPVIFDSLYGKIRMSKAGQQPIDITTDEVFVTDFTFTNLSESDDFTIIKIFFNIERVNPLKRQEYEASANFQTSVTPRK